MRFDFSLPELIHYLLFPFFKMAAVSRFGSVRPTSCESMIALYCRLDRELIERCV